MGGEGGGGGGGGGGAPLFSPAASASAGPPGYRADLGRFRKAHSHPDRRPATTMLPSSNGNHNLVEVPNITAAWPPASEAAGVVWPELQGPPANGLIGHDDAAL